MAFKKSALKFGVFLFFIWFIASSLVRLLPGDPLSLLMAELGTQGSLDFLKEELGLHLPWWKALFYELISYLRGNFGHSIITKNPVLPEIILAAQHTLVLVVPSFFASFLLSFFLAILGIASPRAARTIFLFNGLTAAFPGVLMGPLFMLFFGVWLELLPLHEHWGIPMICLIVSLSGFWSRVFYEKLRRYQSTLHYIASQGKGLKPMRRILYHWILPCAPGIASYLLTQLGALLGGTLVLEIIFDWPGLGNLFFSAVMKRDYPVVQAAVFFVSLFSLLGNTLGEWIEHSFMGNSEK